MFKDSKKELKALEGRMLAAEESRKDPMLDDDFETLFNEIKAEYGSRNDEPPVRNYANSYGRPAPAPAPMPEPRKKRQTGLGFLIFLEIVALTAVLGFWALHLLG